MMIKTWMISETTPRHDSTALEQKSKWNPLGLGSFRINVHAAGKEGQGSFAVGMVLVNSQEQFLAEE